MRQRPDNRISKGYTAAIGKLYGVISEPEPIPTALKIKPRKRAIRRLQRTEADEQAMLVKWLRLQGLLVHSIPNGGKRSVWAGERERAMGLYKGCCDLFLAEPRGKYHGMYIEMKSKGNKPRPEQLAFMELARRKDYWAAWYDSFESARLGVEDYLQC